MNHSLYRSIIETLTYADMFHLPLSAEEVHRGLWKCRASLYDVRDALDRLHRDGHIEKKECQYMLRGQTRLVDIRQLAIPSIDTKLNIASNAARRIRWIPFVRALFVCNTVASASASEDSDIDVFIVIRHGRMWITRLLITFTLSLFRMRRTGAHVANKICLSFYVTDAHLDLSDITIDEPDIYMMHWIDQLIPMYDPHDIRSDIQKKNTWIHACLPNAGQPFVMHPRYRVEDGGIAGRVKHVWEQMWQGRYGDMIDAQAKAIQKKKMTYNITSKQGAGTTDVIVNDTMLKFHEHDRRAWYRDTWRERVKHFVS